MDREHDNGIPSIYENGVFRPESAVNLPEGTRAMVHIPDAATRRLGHPRSDDHFWHGKSVAELAAEQGVKPLTNLNDLRGDWPPEDSIDEFLKSLREGRR